MLILPLFSNGDIINYLKQNPGKTDNEKIELVRTCLACVFDTFVSLMSRLPHRQRAFWQGWHIFTDSELFMAGYTV